MYDVIIAGSGPAGTFAAYGLQDRKTLVLDAGNRAPGVPDLRGNLYQLLRERGDLFEELIGSGFEGLHNVHKRNISLKLKAPFMSYIVRDSERLLPIRSSEFHAMSSFAAGGLANAWGAGVFRFNQRDLAGFPLAPGSLEPFYDEVGAHIGISGAVDDLASEFGVERHLQQPIRLGALCTEILGRYGRSKHEFHGQGIRLGRSRLAVLTELHNGRTPYEYDNLDFYRPYNPAIYNPVFTLDDLAARNRVSVASGFHVERFEEGPDAVEVIARNLKTDGIEKFRCRKLILAAGTLGTSRIVLESAGDRERKLPILDNPMVCLPLFRLARVGSAQEDGDSSLGQLNVVYEDGDNGDVLQGTIYGTGGPLRSDILFELPLSISANLALARYLSPAMLLLMLFYPGKRSAENCIRLAEDGKLEIRYDWRTTGRPERRLMKAFHRLGLVSWSGLLQYPPAGSSLHYAGTLPMKESPGPYETGPDGRLFGTQHIHVADGACFSELPAKNLTLTIMANALRIARTAGRSLD